MNILKTCSLTFCHPLHSNMPKYAVAVGRCTGVFDTYEECKQQILHYPNAKFKKFDTVEEAEEFILKFGKSSSSNFNLSEEILRVENRRPPQLFSVQKTNSSSESTLSCILAKLNQMEDKLNKFMSSTSASMQHFNERLVALENCSDGLTDLRPQKRMKLEEPLSIEVDQTSFIRNEDGVVKVFTDGACVNNGRVGAKAGIGVWFNHGHPLNISAPVKGPATNNNAEIQAARYAISQAACANLNKLIIHTDSKFLINCITEWINKWKKNNWKLVNGDDVKNKVELVKLDEALQKLERVEWIYVRGHKGIEGNEMADKLARDGAALYEINVTYSDNST